MNVSLFQLSLLGTVAAVMACRSPETLVTDQAVLPATNPAEKGAIVKSVTIPVEGMSCGACAASIRRSVTKLHGVQSVEVDLVARNARVQYVDGQTTPIAIASAIVEAGFKAASPLETP